MENTFKKEKAENYLPHVVFDLNQDLNARLLSQSLTRGVNKGGMNVREVALRDHPTLEEFVILPDEERLQKTKEYLSEYYSEHSEEIEGAIVDIKNAWDKYAPTFFNEVKKIFPNTPWPQGKYVGHVSVSRPCPRFLETKTFCVINKPIKRSVPIIAHEMLHFIFYEYVRNRYLSDMPNTIQKEMDNRLDEKFKIPLWELSEIFNLVILSGEEWKEGKANMSASSYEHLVKQVPEFQKLWDESNHNVNRLFDLLEV